jgi:hypothetical protein
MVRILVLLISLCFGGGLSMGGIVPRYTVGELAANSEKIVEGRVTHQWTAWDRRHLYIWTHYQVQVVDVLKGEPAGVITVSEPGGSLDGIGQLFSGAVPYAIGEHVLLFLYRTPIDYLRTRGGTQGKFSVQSNTWLAALKLRIRELVKLETH